MSSSDDSDVCDFSSNIEKLLNKRNKKFDETFKNKTREEPITTKECVQEDASTSNIEISSTDDECCELPDNQSKRKTRASNKSNRKKTVKPTNVEESPPQQTQTNEAEDQDVSLVEDVQERIKNKLEELQEAVTDILEPKTRQTRSSTRRGRGARRGRGRAAPKNTRRNATVPLPALVTSDGEDEISVAANVEEKAEDPNPLVTVTVEWQTIYKNTFQVKKFQRLSVIFDFYLKKTNANSKLLFFTLNDKEINLSTSCYVSLRLNEKSIIEGGLLPESCLTREVKPHRIIPDPDDISLRVQYADRRSTQLDVYLKQSDSMGFAIWQIMNDLGVEFEKIKVYFDGIAVKPSDTIEYLEIEDGDCLDVTVISE